MSKIRKTVELFCVILQENGFSKVKAEMLRQAKYNENAVCQAMWRLLYEVVYFCDYGYINKEAGRMFKAMSQVEVVLHLKDCLYQRGYLLYDFLSLPDDMSTGSQTLLHTVGWLFCEEDIMSRVMRKCVEPLPDDSRHLHQEMLPSDPLVPPITPVEEPVEQVRQVLWYNNKLHNKLKLLHSLRRENALQQNKMHEATYGVSPDPSRRHLSMFEIHMLRHPDLLDENLKSIEEDNERLEHLLLWSEEEDTFWQWMESSLDAVVSVSSVTVVGEETASEAGEVGADGQEGKAVVVQRGCNILRTACRRLERSISVYEDALTSIEDSWNDKLDNVTEAQLDALLEALDQEVLEFKACFHQYHSSQELANQNQPSLDQNQPVFPRLSLVKDSPRKRATGPVPPEEPPRSLQEETGQLDQFTSSLAREITYLRELVTREMMGFSKKFGDALVVPPMEGEKYFNK